VVGTIIRVAPFVISTNLAAISASKQLITSVVLRVAPIKLAALLYIFILTFGTTLSRKATFNKNFNRTPVLAMSKIQNAA
jgi:hypothetical protein